MQIRLTNIELIELELKIHALLSELVTRPYESTMGVIIQPIENGIELNVEDCYMGLCPRLVSITYSPKLDTYTIDWKVDWNFVPGLHNTVHNCINKKRYVTKNGLP